MQLNNTINAACLVLVFGLVPLSSLQAQIVVDWPTQQLTSYPQIVDKTISATVIVKNVNNLLYQYDIKVAGTPRLFDDAASLLSIGSQASIATAGGLVPGASNCLVGAQKLNTSVSDISKAVNVIMESGKDAAGTIKSVPLQQTLDDWKSTVKPILETIASSDKTEGSMAYVALQCTDVGEKKNVGDPAFAKAQVVRAEIESLQRKINGPHQIEDVVSLQEETDYTITIKELLDGKPTPTVFKQSFSPSSNILFLSLGVLMSKIEQRSYISQKDPNNTAQNLLAVNGRGAFSPLGTALLNYNVFSTKDNKWSLALSSGLVLAFGTSNVSASSLGWFGGGSVALHHRLFFTLGAHVGQFSDFPTGLQKGSVVPANYGDLNAINRTTTRFAFGVTYQTKSFASTPAKPKAADTSKK